MNDAFAAKIGEALQSRTVAHAMETMRDKVEGLSRVERAVLACCMGYELAQEDFAELEALKGEDGKAWRWFRNSVGMRVLPDGTPQVWTGETLPPPMPGEVAKDGGLFAMGRGRVVQ